MKTECCLVKDLLPLYAENMVSDGTAALVEQHLNECADCAAEAERLRQPEAVLPASNTPKDEAAPLKRVKKELIKRRIAAAVLAAAIVFVAAFAVFSFITRPNYVPFEKSGAEVNISADGVMSVSFSERVTSYRFNGYKDAEDGAFVVEIAAWSSVWDKILGKQARDLLLTDRSGISPDRVFYMDATRRDDNLLTIYGEAPEGGATALPRLFLGAYFIAALALAAILGILLFVFRRREKAARILTFALFAPVSYLAAHLVLLQGFISYSAARDFVMLCIAAAGVYAALAAGYAVRRFGKI